MMNKLVGKAENCNAEGSSSFFNAIPSKKTRSYNKSFTVPLGSFEASVMKLFAAACNLISYTVSENKEQESVIHLNYTKGLYILKTLFLSDS